MSEPSPDRRINPLPADAAESATSPEMLDAVMRRTLERFRGAAGQPVKSTEAEAIDVTQLRQVATKFAGRKLESAIAEELTSVVLRDPFAAVVASEADWSKLVKVVTQQIFENPDARWRLEQFWAQLSRGAT